MIDERNRQRMKEALVKPFGAPRPDLERLAIGAIDQRPRRRPAGRAVALALFLLLMVLAVSVALAGRALRPASQVVGSPQQSVLLEQLRQRSLNLPGLLSDGSCPATTLVTKNVFFNKDDATLMEVYGGHGPIDGIGGPELTGRHGYYYFVTWISDPTYQGLALIRGRRLDGPQPVVFAGRLAAGHAVVTDSLPPLAGFQTGSLKFYDQLIIPAGSNGGFWRSWPVTQGVAGPGCYGFQIDGPSFQELVVVQVPQGG